MLNEIDHYEMNTMKKVTMKQGFPIKSLNFFNIFILIHI